jgi:hypothetical protein
MGIDFIQRGPAEGLGMLYSEAPRKRNIHERKYTDSQNFKKSCWPGKNWML